MADPAGLAELVSVFGGPNQEGFGSAVFHEELAADADLAGTALACYRHFRGRRWSAADEAGWQLAGTRPAGAAPDILAELRALPDAQARRSAAALPDCAEDPERAARALAAVFDAPGFAGLTIHRIGDGEALNGVMIAGRDAGGCAVFLAFLMD